MTRPINPYIAGNPLRGEKGFFGRQDALQWVERELRNPATNVLVLAGQRRIGKTSLLLQLERTLSGEDFLPIYFDLQNKAARPLGQVLAELAGKIARRIKWQSPEPESFDDQGQFFQNFFLPSLYKKLEKNCRPVLLLDEFDVMDRAAKEEMPEHSTARLLLAFLHSLMIEDALPAFVFAVGRQAEDLSYDSSVILKTSLRRDIWILDKDSAEQLVRNAEENGTLHFTDRAVDGILNLTSGHPYLTQLLCQRIWERAYSTDSTRLPEIDLPEVKAAIPDALETGQQVLFYLWDGLNPAEQIYTSALAEVTEKEDDVISENQVVEVLTKHAPKLRTREVELAPRDLVKHWVLEESGKQEYRFAVELLRLWVRSHKPLRDVENELDEREPLAKKYYELGKAVLRRGKTEDAINHFQHALEVNPNHLHALLDLGEALLRLGRNDEAVARLEDAYKQNDVEAHFPLARALIAQAKVKEKNGDSEDALIGCKRALELSPGEQTAHEIIRTIWEKRGSIAMEQGDIEKAFDSYQNAGVKSWDDMVDLVRRALDEDPALFRTRFYLGEVLLDLNRTDEALAESNSALMAYQQASVEHRPEIIVFFQNVLEQKPDRTLARLLLGQLLLVDGQSREALSELKRAYEEDKSNNKALITYILLVRAEAAHVTGEWLMALEDCAAILQIDPGQKHALEIMNETISQVKEAGGGDLPNSQFTRERLAHMHLGAKSTFGFDRNRLCELACTARNQIRFLGVIALNANWQSLAHKWVASLKDEPTFEITILCESDNILFSKSLTYDMDAAENRRSFQELQFIRDRALIDFPDILLDKGVSILENSRITIEITHLPIPVSVVQIDGRIFANLWLHDIEDRFEEIVSTHPWHSHMKEYISTYFDPMRGRKYASKSGEEALEVFDHKGMPRGIYPRHSFYDTDYSQQVIWAFIFDRQGRLLIHRRADNAKDNQGVWDKSVGGHMEFTDFNNTSHAAYREVIEELFVAEPERKKSSLKKWKISDDEIIYLGEWRPEQRKSYPFKEISSFKREWAYFRFRESERLYSPRTLPNGTVRRLRVIPDIFFFVAGPQLTGEFLNELENSTFKLIELSELKNALNGSLSNKIVPGFDKNKSGDGDPIPKFSPDLIEIMTGKIYDNLVEFSQYIQRYIQQQ